MSRAMQDALQQVLREKDAAFREKDTENAFSEMPLEAKCGGMRHIMVLVTRYLCWKGRQICCHELLHRAI